MDGSFNIPLLILKHTTIDFTFYIIYIILILTGTTPKDLSYPGTNKLPFKPTYKLTGLNNDSFKFRISPKAVSKKSWNTDIRVL